MKVSRMVRKGLIVASMVVATSTAMAFGGNDTPEWQSPVVEITEGQVVFTNPKSGDIITITETTTGAVIDGGGLNKKIIDKNTVESYKAMMNEVESEAGQKVLATQFLINNGKGVMDEETRLDAWAKSQEMTKRWVSENPEKTINLITESGESGWGDNKYNTFVYNATGKKIPNEELQGKREEVLGNIIAPENGDGGWAPIDGEDLKPSFPGQGETPGFGDGIITEQPEKPGFDIPETPENPIGEGTPERPSKPGTPENPIEDTPNFDGSKVEAVQAKVEENKEEVQAKVGEAQSVAATTATDYNNRLGDTRSQMKEIGAQSAAMTSAAVAATQQLEVGEMGVGAGFGSYSDKSAAAISVGLRPTENTNVNASWSHGDDYSDMVGVGAGYKFNIFGK